MNNVILDNWTFQSVGELFKDGYGQKRLCVLVRTGRVHG